MYGRDQKLIQIPINQLYFVVIDLHSTLQRPLLDHFLDSFPSSGGRYAKMSVDSATYSALLDMGIEPPVARKAATMYTKVDAAVEWCFGPGLEVRLIT